MDQDPRTAGAQVGAREAPPQTTEPDRQRTPEEIRADIEQTREEVGDTVEALAAKTDVKTRARERADELKRNARAKKDELLSKAKQASPVGRGGDDDGEGGVATAGSAGTTADRGHGGGVGSVAERLKSQAQQNPVPTAALAAFVGGVAFGRLTSRR